jgi:hypothetical protein
MQLKNDEERYFLFHSFIRVTQARKLLLWMKTNERRRREIKKSLIQRSNDLYDDMSKIQMRLQFLRFKTMINGV